MGNSRDRNPHHVFGPELDTTIEIGDVFWNRDTRVRAECVVVGKVYHDDLSLSYRLFYPKTGRTRTAAEHYFTDTQDRKYTRIKKTTRTILQTEKIYKGVTLWSSRKLTDFAA